MIDAKLGDLINQKDYGGDDYEEMEYAPVICQVTFKLTFPSAVYFTRRRSQPILFISTFRDLWMILHFVYISF